MIHLLPAATYSTAGGGGSYGARVLPARLAVQQRPSKGCLAAIQPLSPRQKRLLGIAIDFRFKLEVRDAQMPRRTRSGHIAHLGSDQAERAFQSRTLSVLKAASEGT